MLKMIKIDGFRAFKTDITNCVALFRVKRVATLILFFRRVKDFYCLYKKSKANNSQTDSLLVTQRVS